jgi:sugar phosphate isomerase/epimerase
MHNPPVSRRKFVSLGVVTLGTATQGSLKPAHAIAPIVRKGKQRLRLSLAAYSMRQFLAPKPGSPEEKTPMDLMGFVDYASELDVDAVELTSYYFPTEITPGYLARLKRHCHLKGLDISGGAIRNNFTSPPGSDEVEKSFDHVGMWLDHYAALGVGVIRVFAGEPAAGSGISEQQAIDNAIVNMRRACVMAGQRGIILGLENHDFLMHIDRLIPIVQAVDSPWFGVNFDAGNVISKDPYREMARIAPYTVNAQIKVNLVKENKTAANVPLDMIRVVKILKDSGYSGYIVLEYEADEDPRKAIPRHLRVLRRAIG